MFRMKVSASISISIHAPPRGATRALQFHPCYLQFQFTPLREGRLGEAQTVIEAQAISIHAPPRGATQLIGIGCGSSIFQFTPLREGRRPG